jgi:hypothetical protein
MYINLEIINTHIHIQLTTCGLADQYDKVCSLSPGATAVEVRRAHAHTNGSLYTVPASDVCMCVHDCVYVFCLGTVA